jgi:phosphate starvation-inducible protein PhoH
LFTRIGSNCKLIACGDTNQIDLKNKDESSLQELIEIFKDSDKIGTVVMNNSDENVRNPLIKEIEQKYSELYKKLEKKQTNNNKKNNNNYYSGKID